MVWCINVKRCKFRCRCGHPYQWMMHTEEFVDTIAWCLRISITVLKLTWFSSALQKREGVIVVEGEDIGNTIFLVERFAKIIQSGYLLLLSLLQYMWVFHKRPLTAKTKDTGINFKVTLSLNAVFLLGVPCVLSHWYSPKNHLTGAVGHILQMNQSSKWSCELPRVAKDSKPDVSASKSDEECRSLVGGQISVAASFLVSWNVHWLSQCWMKPQKFVFSKFGRLEVQTQGTAGLLFSEAPLLGFQLLVAVSSQALPSALPCPTLFSKGQQWECIRIHHYDLIQPNFEHSPFFTLNTY